MKKTTILTAGILSMILLFAGCSNADEPFTQKEYSAEATQIKEISIDVRDRQIEVSQSKDNKIHIDYFVNAKEHYDISISNDSVLTMTAKSDKEWSDYIGGKADTQYRKISLQLPDTLLSTLKLSTTNEDILLPELTVTDLISLSVNGGNITFEKLNPGNTLDLNSKNGNINGTILGSYDDYFIHCEIKKGESNLPSSKNSGTKKLSVTVNNGDATVDFKNL